jgi:hypothetical protein
MMAAVKPCLSTPGERTQKVWACIKFCGAQELVSVSKFHQAACPAWIPIWLSAHWVRDRDGKSGRKTSTAKDLKSVLKPFAHTPLLKPSVPCVIIVVPGTWMTHQSVFQDAYLLLPPFVVHPNIDAWFPHGSILSLALMSCTLAHTGARANNPAIVVLSRLSTGTAATCY